MPDVRGVPLEEAQILLRGAPVHEWVVTKEGVGGLTTGPQVVYDQDPPPGAVLSDGGTIRLSCSEQESGEGGVREPRPAVPGAPVVSMEANAPTEG